MVRLARKNIKVFAGNATNNGVFGSLQQNNPRITNDVEELQSLNAWNEGWNAATMTSEELPPLEEIQGVEYVTTYQQAYIMQEGVPEWSATVTYYKGSLVKQNTSDGFRIYNSLVDDNIGNILSNTSAWKKVMDSSDLYAMESDVVTLAGDQTITGGKAFENGLFKDNNNIDINVNPSANQSNQIWFRDKNDVGYGVVQCNQETDGTVGAALTVKSRSGNPYASLSILQDASGVATAYAPTPAASSNGAVIATTKWVRDFAKSSSSGYSTYKSGATIPSNTDYTVPSNGVIAGEISAAQNGSVKVNIDGVTVEQVGSEKDQRCRAPFYAIVKKGQVVKLAISGNAVVPLAKFYAFS